MALSLASLAASGHGAVQSLVVGMSASDAGQDLTMQHKMAAGSVALDLVVEGELCSVPAVLVRRHLRLSLASHKNALEPSKQC